MLGVITVAMFVLNSVPFSSLSAAEKGTIRDVVYGTEGLGIAQGQRI